jgi:N6-adenosine-specific RNA methylase IME4
MNKYGTILADPPWLERGGGKIKRGADRHYPLMHTKDICALPVATLAAPDAHLYLWVTNNFLPDGLQVMAAWEFRYVTMITWTKDRFGLGQYFRGMTEHCLFGVRGKPGYRVDESGRRCQGVTLINAPRSQHSAKPWELRQMIERVSPGPYLELFARESAHGWDVWGNQVESTVEISAARPTLLEVV